MRKILYLTLNYQFKKFDDQHLINNVNASSLCCYNIEIDYQTIKMLAIKKIVDSIILN